MIDIHNHCLPGIDDGPRDWAGSVELCRAALDEGIDQIVATPHVLRGKWANESHETIREMVDQLNDRLGGSPRILPGSEFYFAYDLLELLRSGKSIISLNQGRYVLIEFPATSVPPMLDNIFFQAQIEGWIPVIAHPERNLEFQKHPELLEALVIRGARVQVTSGSIVGRFGKEAERCSRQWMQGELIHVVATDAHSLEKRPPVVTEARKRVVEWVGEARAAQLFDANPSAIAANQRMPYDPEPELLPRLHWWQRWLHRAEGRQR